MENDDDIQLSKSLYPTLHVTRITETLFESFGLNTNSVHYTQKEIEQALHDEDWMVRLKAVKSLGVLGKEAEIMRMAHDENECVRLLAQYELQRLALIEASSSSPVESGSQETLPCADVHHWEHLSPEKVQIKESEKQKERYTITWRELLEVLLEDPYALEKITKLLHVSRETIMNWIQYKSNPDFRIFQQILEAFPDEYAALLELIQREFPRFVPERLADGEEPLEILESFHDRLSETLRENPPMLRFWSTSQLVLRQAMQQLDPYRTGLMMAILLCTAPSSGKKVRSLHGYLGLGVSAMMGNWYQQPLFFGSDSLSGYAAMTGTVQVIQDLKSDMQGISFYDVDDMRSVLVVPILSANKCAGSLYVASTSPDYFGPRRLELVQQYAACLARAFSPEEFYAPDEIQLELLPYKTQLSYFNTVNWKKDIVKKETLKLQREQNEWSNIEDGIISLLQEKQEISRTRFLAQRPIVELGIQQARYQVESELFMLLSAMPCTERWQDLLA